MKHRLYTRRVACTGEAAVHASSAVMSRRQRASAPLSGRFTTSLRSFSLRRTGKVTRLTTSPRPPSRDSPQDLYELPPRNQLV